MSNNKIIEDALKVDGARITISVADQTQKRSQK